MQVFNTQDSAIQQDMQLKEDDAVQYHLTAVRVRSIGDMEATV